ncbi:MAG: ligase 1 [Alphaproteobacteria bacterium]|jgi:DNA ligase-1|nr:ligase 1 [Alphaproteobacteria bacterium]
MNRFAALLDRLAYEPSRNNKLRLMTDYFRSTPDPERGYALAALTGALSFQHAKPGMIRTLIAERTDPVLFALSHDYVGDLSETVALMWPGPPVQPASPSHDRPFPSPHERSAPSPREAQRAVGRVGVGGDAQEECDLQSHPPPCPSPTRGEGTQDARPIAELITDRASSVGALAKSQECSTPKLSDVVATLSTLAKSALPAQLARWLDALDETGRWALLKLVTGGLRVGVSARLAKTAAAALGDADAQEVELVWPGLAPPYLGLFAWLEGRADKPMSRDPAPFRPAMLAHAVDENDLAGLDPADFLAEWKWDGIRVQAAAGRSENGGIAARLYSRTGEDISSSFPDLLETLRLPGAIDGELLILRDRRVQSFNVLQQRLNRKTVNAKLIAKFPAHLRAYDLLVEGEEDLRALPFADRRKRLEAFVARLDEPRIDISPLVPFATWDELAAARKDPASAGAGDDAEAVEGVMLKRRDAPYVPGRPKGPWWKWKRDPFLIDAVLMYAQRGHGKRSSYYSDYTFGVWTAGDAGDMLVPVGKAYFGFTDEELLQIDRYVRRNTVDRFGPVREVVHEPSQGLVLEVAFEGLQRSTRHKSGLAMRFPRIHRLRWDKPPGEADRLETLERLLDADAGRSTESSNVIG